MADRTTVRVLLAGWLFAAASIVVFAWLTAGPYVRQNFRPLPGEAGLTMRECTADPSCAPDAVDLVNHQLAVLRQTRTVVSVSAWSISVAIVIVVAIATLLVLRRQRASLGIAGTVLPAGTAALLILQVVMLARGANVLAETPEPARMVTFIKAFDAPFTDVGHLYYLIWFTGVGVAAALLVMSYHARIRLTDERTRRDGG